MIGLAAAQTQEFEVAGATDLATFSISPSGNGIHFSKLDVGLYLPGLMEDLFGMKVGMAERGRKGGQAATRVEKAAARANGKLGGRPRKIEKVTRREKREAARSTPRDRPHALPLGGSPAERPGHD